MNSKDNYLDILSKVPIFSAIDRETLLLLYNRCCLKDAVRGSKIIEKNSGAEEIMVVLSGEVSVILNHNDEDIEVARLSVGSCIGEASVIGIQNHSADVIAIKDSTLLVLSRTELMNMYKDDLNIFAIFVLNIARELARRLKATDNYIETHKR